MKTLLLVVGIIVLLNGLLWTGQGLGVIRWPQESFMISQAPWVWYGAATALAGVVLIWWARRR